MSTRIGQVSHFPINRDITRIWSRLAFSFLFSSKSESMVSSLLSHKSCYCLYRLTLSNVVRTLVDRDPRDLFCCVFLRRDVNNLEKVRLDNAKCISLLLTSQSLSVHMSGVGGEEGMEEAKFPVFI